MDKRSKQIIQKDDLSFISLLSVYGSNNNKYKN